MFRILTYNVHYCRGTDGRVSPTRIAEVIASCRPDIVALQELDVGRARSGRIDQAREIARELGMHMLFHPSIEVMEERYGNAILSVRPAKLVKAGGLPSRPRAEPRGALWATVQLGGANLQVVTTHLGLRRPERLLQVETLLGPEWLGHPACREPFMLLGDFNAVPRSRAYRSLAMRLDDASAAVTGRGRIATFPSWLPVARLDHVFACGIEVSRVETLRGRLARVASDHLPLLVEFQVAAAHERPARSGAVLERAGGGSGRAT